MCGIVGLYLNKRRVNRKDIDAMNSTIVHRGPDDDGVFVNGSAGIGMRRLSIIDLDGGQQPIPNETRRIHVVQNGELYNYRELRRELQDRGHRFRTLSDTEVAVHAYEEWGGVEFAKHLRGMFAIAIWDSVEQAMWLVRDRLGIKPLYYAETPDGVAFASEVKALLASPIVSCELQPSALAQYLIYGSASQGGSFIRGVKQLLPGQVACFSGGRSRFESYWEFRFPEHPLALGEEEAREVLLERLRDTVRLHMVSDVPVGAFLSGGVDSSAIVGLMAQEGAAGLKTFSIGFGEESFNELPYAAKVAERWGTDHHTEIVCPDDALHILDDLIYHLDEPFADASAIPTWYVSRLAAQNVKVVLTGDGGDELFAGYSRYAGASQDIWLDRIPLMARRLGSSLSRFLPQWWPGKYFLDYAGRDALARYVYGFHRFPAPLRRRILRPEWSPEYLGVEDPAHESLRTLRGSGAGDSISECMHFDILRYLPLDILVKVDRMTMAHSLEARPPMLDHEFVEFAASLPIGMKFSGSGRSKHILKKAVAPLMPEGLLDRKKAGFAVPLQRWFAGPLASLYQDQVLAGGLCTDYFDPGSLRIIFNENRMGRRNHGHRLWAILVLELWLRRNFQKH